VGYGATENVWLNRKTKAKLTAALNSPEARTRSDCYGGAIETQYYALKYADTKIIPPQIPYCKFFSITKNYLVCITVKKYENGALADY
jgi:hypothetical protein